MPQNHKRSGRVGPHQDEQHTPPVRWRQRLPAGLTLAASALMFALLSACADRPDLQAGRQVAAVPAAGYVLGRIHTLENGEERVHRTALFPVNPFDVFVWSARTGQFERHGLEGDGSFTWALPPGDYAVAGYQAYAPLRVGRIWTQFRVPEAGRSAYIGTLRIEVSEAGYRFAVEDRFDQAIATVRPSLPVAVGEPAKALMTLEPPLGRVAQVWPLCSKRSGLVCDRSLQGLAATLPAGSGQGFPTVDSLMPTLAWQAAAPSGFTYDVAVYESLVINPVPGFIRTLRGPLAAYAEGLEAPSWQIGHALRPDRKYEWSVRLRDGDAVSTWTTTGSFAFYVVAFFSSSGKWFGFTTPGP
jgi:hypothetical protein